jgi:hypothetical protein
MSECGFVITWRGLSLLSVTERKLLYLLSVSNRWVGSAVVCGKGEWIVDGPSE